ncbi:carboxypeptidase-like regulatory domain-containing protein [Salinibacter grassmerensis]|uniref:carboxypeptidase-like regulatory domain-containing protein n=1 Tax=Salinibacter grassmerensis TaxID=3040353 RepID=UPI0021E8791A|nr:carboxypeptidase-like regulatory domain-containing protein [Salinibacter grassmerensis]
MRRRTGFRRLVFSFCLFALLAAGQEAGAQQSDPARGRATLVGTVVDSATGDPLSDVNVFIAESMRGTTTDDQGRFRLTGVPLGAQQLYVSFVGYESTSRSLNLRESRPYRFEFALQETVLEGEGVVVEAERDEQWQRRFERFKAAFLGETPNAEQAKIRNREVLSFDGGMGSLEAFAARPIVIENKALGYRVEYHLEDFKVTQRRTQYDGEPFFEELEGSPAQEAKWEKARREAFLGSFHHLMLAMIEDRVEEQGFKLFYRQNAPGGPPGRASSDPPGGGSFGSGFSGGGGRMSIEVSDIMTDGDAPDEHILDFQGAAEIIYLGEKQSEAYSTWREERTGRRGGRAPRYQTSQFWLERGPATVDYKGEVVERYGVTVSGYFGFERVADQVPKEYRPQ